jgi:hypothetical protein
MKSKFKLYPLEKILFIILPLIFIINCYPYMVEEIKMIPIKKANRNNPLFARLELGSPCCTPGHGIDSEESIDTVERYVKTLDEDAKKKVKEAGEGLRVELHYNELSSKEDLKKGSSSTFDFHYVVHGYFKEGLSEHNEVQFEVLSIYRNLNIWGTGKSSGSYFWGLMALNLFFLLIIIDIIIRVLIYIFYKIKKMIHS